ncbi:helix-turn-helix domain-containing protein [Zooshikella ganghwensis]|nr:helix-turn-helix transcriptional regulator [Zooshikella ganghwensis]
MKAAGLDEKELAKATGVPSGTIVRLLYNPSSNPTVNTLIPLMKFFSISMDQLLGLAPLPLQNQHEENLINKQTASVLPVMPLNALSACLYKNKDDKAQKVEWIHTGYYFPHDAGLAVKVDSAFYYPTLQKNTVIIVDCEKVPQSGDLILLLHKSERNFFIRQYFQENRRQYIRGVTPNDLFTESFDDASMQLVGTIVETHYSYKGLRKSKLKPKDVKQKLIRKLYQYLKLTITN